MIESNFNKELEHKIDLYVNGRLSADEVDALWAELVQDEYYLDYLKSIANLKKVIESRKSKRSTSRIYVLRQYARYAAAAAVVIVAGVLGIMNSGDTGMGIDPVATIALDNVRGVDDNNTGENETIRQALRMATNGNIPGAISMLEGALQNASNDSEKAEIALSLGSIQYNNNMYSEAISNFTLITEQTSDINKLILEEAYYYLGNAYLQMDQFTLAKVAFESALSLDGAFSRVAKTYLDALSSAD
ncbi:tol-pal system YbgF family protein [Balneola sp. MJW-20]|uniref:tetratricopeptide repeat protein n=1 Tax=Gracilimonas aurantiaca TaxID=3234185 RepID=UPI003467C574